jgi:nucleoside-diphosphate-sugar epimerase
MKALIIGNPGSLPDVIAAEFVNHEYEHFCSDDRGKIPDQEFDVCIDMSAKGIRDVKRTVNALRRKCSHYILVSTCRVYPATVQPVPWRPEKIDLCDETGFDTLDLQLRQYRAAERELRHLGKSMMPWTIVRPAIVEEKSNSAKNNMWWFVSRIRDGGPIVLPDSDDPLFRHVSAADLARALRIIAGQGKAYFQTINVTSSALLTYESYARLIMRAMGRKVSIARVPSVSFAAAGLDLPMGKYLHSSFIEDSPLLKRLGWLPGDELLWIQEYVQYLLENPPAGPTNRNAELALLATPPPEKYFVSALPAEPVGWSLVGKPGEPLSIHLERCSDEKKSGVPVLKTRRITLGGADSTMLLKPSTATEPRIMGHNVVLELVDPGDSGLTAGAWYLPVAQRPCGDPRCSYCTDHLPGLAGVTDDGFGAEYVSVPPRHLVQVPGEISELALFADPLACLLSVLSSLLTENSAPVWIFGQLPDALLALFLVMETERPLVHVNRTGLFHADLPDGPQYLTIQQAEKKVADKSLVQPTMVINLSGSRDGENILVNVLADGGIFVSPYTATQAHRRRLDMRLPLAAPGRIWIERALEKLTEWSKLHEIGAFRKEVPLDYFPELFVVDRFVQCFVELKGAAR